MQFVFCILFFKQFESVENVFFSVFQQICCTFIISNIREGRGGGQVVNAQNYVSYFESDIAKVFPFRPTCSSYDSEIK